MLSERREKEEIIRKILPRIAKKLSDILEKMNRTSARWWQG